VEPRRAPAPGTAWTVTSAEASLRLDKFLAAPGRLGSRGRVATALARGKVFLNETGVGPPQAALRLSVGDVVRVWMDRPGSARPRLEAFVDGDLRILHEDDDLVVVDKPPGLLTVPLDRRTAASSVFDLIERHWRSQQKRRPLVVHRIDRDTSGLVVFAVHARAQRALKEQFRRREPERVYLAVVSGVPRPAAGEWRDRLVWLEAALIQRGARTGDPRGVEAISAYRVVEAFGAAASLLEVRLTTGKQNQIRVQAQLHGHPLVGERRYVDAGEKDGHRGTISFPRQALHAYRLAFRHPADGRELRFEAPVPTDLVELLERLRSKDKGQGQRPGDDGRRPPN
jgi:23S rRNA pseudouridine1911/1915/1917 synthase